MVMSVCNHTSLVIVAPLAIVPALKLVFAKQAKAAWPYHLPHKWRHYCLGHVTKLGRLELLAIDLDRNR